MTRMPTLTVSSRSANLDLDAADLMRRFNLDQHDLPAVIGALGPVAPRNPPTWELADRIGLTEPFDETVVYDVAVVGAGPSGLAAAVMRPPRGSRMI